MSLTVDSHLDPVPDEIDAVGLPVEGAIPAELRGRYVRNGANALPGEPRGHHFAGHGMLHGVRLCDGRAEWYRNRWVRTRALAGHRFFTWRGMDLRAVPANTHLVEHGGRLLALVEQGLPYEVDAELGTVGPHDFGGRLTTAMAAHPKIDPVSGDLHFYGYSPRRPYLTYHRADATGALVASRPVDVAAPTLMHDFAITEHHAVWLDLPMTFQWRRLVSGMPFGWDERHGARIGVMRLDDERARVRWFEIEPCYVFHVGTACEDERGRIVLDGARYAPADIRTMWGGPPPTPLDGDPVGRATARGVARLHRWVLDPAAGTVVETPLHDRGLEMPTLDDTRTGRFARHRYAVVSSPRENAVVKADLGGVGSGTGAGATMTSHELGPDVVAGEAVFVARSDDPGRAEDDGWLITITTRRDGSASQLLVLDASDLARVVARVTLPRGVPTGFHGSWIPDTALDPGTR